METNQVRYFLRFAKRRTSHERPNVAGYLSRPGATRSSVSKKNSVVRLSHRRNGASLPPLGVAIRPYLDQSTSVQKVSDARRDMFRQPTWSQFQRERGFAQNFLRYRVCGLCSFYWSTIRSPALLRDRNARHGEYNCGRSRFGSDNRYETSATTGCAVRGLSIGAPK